MCRTSACPRTTGRRSTSARRHGIALLGRWQRWLATQSQRATPRLARAGAGRTHRTPRHGRLLRTASGTARAAVLAPVTAHYSWSKGLKLLGLGRAQLELLPERGMRLDADALETTLDDCARDRQPVLMVVAVLGTTEYGTIDPVDRSGRRARSLAGARTGVRRACRRRLGRLPGHAVPQSRWQPAPTATRSSRLSPLPATRSPRSVRGAGTHRFDHRRSAQARLPAVWRGRVRLPRPSARCRCWPNRPTTFSTRRRPRTTWHVTAVWDNSSRKAPSPAPRPPRCT